MNRRPHSTTKIRFQIVLGTLKTRPGTSYSGFFVDAPGRAHLRGGESPLLARQREELADGKGFAGDCESEGSPKAKRWPDVQEVDTSAW